MFYCILATGRCLVWDASPVCTCPFGFIFVSMLYVFVVSTVIKPDEVVKKQNKTKKHPYTLYPRLREKLFAWLRQKIKPIKP